MTRTLMVNFKSIVDKIPCGLVVVSYQGVTLYANPTATKILNKSLDDLIGTPTGFPPIRDIRSQVLFPKIGQGSQLLEFQVTELIWQEETAYLITFQDINRPRLPAG